MNVLPRYARSSVTRYMLAKLAENQHDNSTVSRREWYEIDVSRLPNELQTKFFKSQMDDETESFISSCAEKSAWVFTQFYHSIVKLFLGLLVSATTINGLLDRGKMFIFSSEQFKLMMNLDDGCYNKSMIDLGAGDGMVTKTMATYFKDIYATESSSSMRMRLKEKGFTVLEIDKWTDNKYDVISILNLLDRVHNPSKILNDARNSLNPNGTVLLAVVLPYSPWVEEGSKFVTPHETLPISGDTVEEQIMSLVNDVIEPARFYVKTFTKLPYLCEGDLYDDFFLLYDYLFVLKPNESSL